VPDTKVKGISGQSRVRATGLACHRSRPCFAYLEFCFRSDVFGDEHPNGSASGSLPPCALTHKNSKGITLTFAGTDYLGLGHSRRKSVPLDERPAVVHCPECKESGYANEAEMADRLPYRCLKCGFTWRPFKATNEPIKQSG
jgi:predicted RNA-binding Zn-ribbon protein involved in translation (DUF1610 family)